ncbi:MFS transporter [Oceanobacillus sp. FSL W8-0428]|uniref:MFS transporter n=1 Tax=Oceanobacillus sojae TaxID=582851 RepID=A0A511ZJE4_9BACI|nr:MFS transporter [Oceanobacillus sojae]GEN87571.1 MFS transporter [Oceanobacillus sojae]
MDFSNENSNSQPKYSLLTAILFWCGLVIVASNYLTIPLMSIFSEDFHTSMANTAWTGSAFSLCYAIGCLFTGPLSDRYGRKQVMLTGLVILTMVTFILPIFSSLAWVIAWRSFQGFAAASFAPVAIAYVVDKFPLEKRVTAIGFISSSFLISAIVGQIFSSYISEQFKWQSVFYYFGGIYFLTAVLVLILLPKTAARQENTNLKFMFTQFFRLLTDKRLVQVYSIAVTLLLTFVAFYTILGEYLTNEFGMSADGILYIRIIGIIGMLFAPFAGKLTSQFGLMAVLRAALIIAVLGSLIIGINSNSVFLVFMSIIFVAGIALTVPTLISLIGQLGGKNHGAAVSLYTFILFVGASLGPMIAVLLLQVANYGMAFVCLAILLGISLIISFCIKND